MMWEEFINDVKIRPENHNIYVKLCVDRHLNDIKNQKKYIFDPGKAEKAIKILGLLKHTQGDYGGKPFDIQPFQAFIMAMIFGWVERHTGLRRFKKAYIETARKSGKSEFAAAMQIIMAFFDDEYKAQVYTAATKSDQASFVYDAAKSMAKQLANDSKKFAKRCRIMQYQIIETTTGGYITKMTADSKTNDGANPHFAVCDEVHAHKDDSMIKVLETGMGARKQPLLLLITTAGFNKESACYKFRKVVIDVLSGKVKNENLFGIIFTIDENDDYKNPKVWIKANPNIGNTPKYDSFQALYQSAITEGKSALVEFLTKNLNVWTDSASVWIQDELILGHMTGMEPEKLAGQRCILGLDLSSKVDLTAVTYYFPELNYYFNQYYCPDEKIRGERRVDGVDYIQWIGDNHIKATPGNVIDYEYIVADVLASADRYNIEMLGFDPFNADLIIPIFMKHGLNCIPVRQGIMVLSEPYKRIEAMILSKKLHTDGNPITRWMYSNVQMFTDSSGNIKADKGRSQSKIDGITSLATAMATYMHIEKTKDQELTIDDLKMMYESK